MPSHCCLSVLKKAKKLTAENLWPLILGQSPVGEGGNREHVGRRDMGLLSAPETLVPVRCHVDSDMCLLRKLSTFFFPFVF